MADVSPLWGRRVLLTGASGGIGPYIARALLLHGCQLAITARSQARLEAVAASLRPPGMPVITLPADLLSPDARTGLIPRASEALGGLDVLVNNAAIENAGPFLSLDPATIASTIETNLVAPLHLTRLALPGMLAQGQGHVVNVASLGGKKAPPYDAVYGGTKAGLIEWTSALRAEFDGTGVSLSVVCPGFVTGEGMFARFGIPAPRTIGSCTPAAVAEAVVEAILRDRAEIIVNSVPVRPLLALYALAPGLAVRALRLLGVTAFQRRKVGVSGPVPQR